MIRLQILVIIFFLSNALTGYFAYNYAQGKQAIAENKGLKTQIEEYNHALSIITKNTKNVAEKSRKYSERMADIPLPMSSDCDYSAIRKLHDEAATITNQMLIENRGADL